MKTLIIIRGMPGAGKSTLAQKLKLFSLDGVICEADQFFTDTKGKYHYIPHLVPSAHEWCRRKVITAMEQGVETIIVSNTTTTQDRVKPYLELAQAFGYQVQQIVVFGDFGSIHNVPDETMDKMRQQLVSSLTYELKHGGLV